MPPTRTLVLKNVPVPGGRVADITVQDGIVVHAGAGLAPDQEIDCRGLFVLPAAVDMHVHMRGGTQGAKEDWASGSRSALAGGVTVVVDQPNTVPPLTGPDTLRARILDARDKSVCSFAINSGVTFDTPLSAMWSAGVMAFGETFVAPSSYGDAITPQELESALRTIQSFGGLATIHAEEAAPGTDGDLRSHDRLRPIDGEIRAVEAVQRCNAAGCRLHFCHMSSASSVLAARTAGSVEATPHHLFLSHELFSPQDAYGKVNPPLRSERERKHLWSAWDRIDVVASDHAPHTPAEKERPFAEAPAGIPGVETMVPLLLAQVIEHRITLPSVIQKTSTAPAELLGIPKAGFAPGDRGDFALYPRQAEPLDPTRLHSRCGFSPFEGQQAVLPRTVILGGDVVYDQGEFLPGSPAWFPGRGYYPL